MAIRKTTIFVSDTIMAKYWTESDISPNHIATKSNKKYNWKCQECGETHLQAVSSLFRAGCSLCKKCSYKKRVNNTRKKQLKSRGSVADVPKLLSTWDYINNKGINPNEILSGSPKDFYWICSDCGKSFLRPVCEHKRNKYTVCKECSLKMKKKAKDKIFTPKDTAIINHPRILRLWDKGNKADPSKITIYSRIIFRFLCVDCGKSYPRSPKMVTAGQIRCKECARIQATQKTVETRRHNMVSIMDNPILSKLWDYKHNKNLDPTTISQYAKKEYYWKCPICNTVWFAKPSSKRYACCEKCSKEKGVAIRIQQIIGREGSFGSEYPQWAEEWDYEGNNGITPFDVTPKSNNIYKFICRCGHHYSCSPADRINRHAGCSRCNKSAHTSFTEQMISFYLEKIEYTIPNYKTEIGLELDAYLPNICAAVEYDGPWHENEETKKRDKRKDEYCKINKIRLLRIHATDKCVQTREGSIIFFNPKTKNYQWLMDNICDFLGLSHIVTDITIDGPQILFRISSVPLKTSFEAKMPLLLNYWDMEKNLPLRPHMIGYTSEHILHWHCPVCGYHFSQSPKYISITKYHCPKCAKENQRLNISKARKKQK